jgi:polygalacturonase
MSSSPSNRSSSAETRHARPRRGLARLTAAFAVSAALFAGPAAIGGDAKPNVSAVDDWSDMPAILKRIVPPTFPARDFPVANFGAVADGKTDCRAAIANAIAACTKAGGGRVVVPPGEYFCDGPIHLASNVNLHVAKGATIRFGADPARYLPAVLTRFEGTLVNGHSPRIYVRGATNVAITGEGVLDGNARETLALMKDSKGRGSSGELRKLGAQGVPVEKRVFAEGKWLRPSFVQPFECTNVLIEGVTLKDSTFWVVHPVLCRNVTVRGITVDSMNGNNDGCDPDSSSDVLIENCTFHTGDDCIAIKSGRDQDGWAVGRPAENIVIRNLTMDARHGAICIGSEMSGGVRNVFVEDCKIGSVSSALYFKANLDRGGLIEHVRARRLTADKVRTSFIRFETSYQGWRGENHPPSFRDFVLEDVSCHEAGQYGIFIEGVPASLIRDVTIRRATVDHAVDGPLFLKQAENIRFDQVRLNGELFPATPAPTPNAKRPTTN